MSTSRKIRFGILSTARIATAKVIPAMQRGERTEVVAIASRDLGRAHAAANAAGIPLAYSSYDELLADPNVDAVYNPLPNHEHLPWTTRAAEAGKHVLCEKPIGLTAAEAQALIDVRDRTGRQIQEAFMVRFHPQWDLVHAMLGTGRIGTLRSIVGTFSYFNDDPANVRNVREYGGGGILDIGCYLVMTARWLFGEEPVRVAATVQRDDRFDVDRLASFVMAFRGGTATGTCATQVTPSQRVQLLGTYGKIDVVIPFNTPTDRPARLLVDTSDDLTGAGAEVVETPACNQYTRQGDAFAQALLDGQPAPYPLEDSLKTMKVLDAIVASAARGKWIDIS